MFIKKARIYKLIENVPIAAEALETFKFTDPMPSESLKIGFSPVADQMIYEVGGHRLISVRKDTKIIPPPVVKAELNKQSEAFLMQWGRPPSRKEKAQMTEEILASMMTRAFTKSSYTQAIFTKSGFVIINGSPSDAEMILSLIRKSTGSLPVIPLCSAVALNPEFELNEIVKKKKDSEHFQLGSIYEFQGSDDVTIKLKGLGVNSDEVQGATEYGSTTKVELSSRHGLCFTIDSCCALSGIQWSEAVESSVEDMAGSHENESDEKIAIFNSELFIASEIFEALTIDLIQIFGGFKEG